MASRQKDLDIERGERPIQAVADPILSSPYEEPREHWLYTEGTPEKAGGRRPASYWWKDKRTGSAQADLYAEEQRDDLPLVNALREEVNRWRNVQYRGASSVTKELLHWWSREDAPRRLFFCQREAVETLIYLLELRVPGRSARTGFKTFKCMEEDIERMLRNEAPTGFDVADREMAPSLVDPSANLELPLALRRLGCKMATGAGKTVVMAMLIAWAFCNRARNPATRSFPNGVLVCAPNLTVKKRLQVLKPEARDNYYDEFEIVPAKYREALNMGKVLVTNWHKFKPKSPHSDGGTTYKVVDKGEEDVEAFSLGRLGDLKTRFPLLVLNDEGHHCWRPNIETEEAAKEEKKGKTRDEKEVIEKEIEEARLWLEGLDKINNAGLLADGESCILAAVDLSATPFFLSGSGHPEGRPFPWLISDFGLVDAIESGIVKIPRLPVLEEGGREGKDEAGRPDPKYFRLWKHINDSLKSGDRTTNRRPKPEAVYREAEGALITLAEQWKQRFEMDRAASAMQERVPPVLIVVCDNTEISQVFFEKISGESEEEIPSADGKKTVKQTVYADSKVMPEFANTDNQRRTIRIDSKLLDKIETEGAESKDEAVLRLREIIDTVGKPGQPGEKVRCVVSVSMLTEGWDANNVTHVLGVRAFGSQLLCEQVVGRGLRRRSYTPDPETGRLPPEYVDVYGIPFSLIPFKGKSKESSGEDKPRNHIYAMPERARYEMRFPQVESYVYEIRGGGIKCDVDNVEGFLVSEEPVRVYLDMTRGYDDSPGPRLLEKERFIEQDRESYYENIHMQAILFRITQLILDELMHGVHAEDDNRAAIKLKAKHLLFPQILQVVREYVDRKVTYGPDVNPKELALEKYTKLIVQRIRDGIQSTSAEDAARLLPVTNSFHPFLSTADVDYTTVQSVVPIERSHLNAVRLDSNPEKNAADHLDSSPFVEYFTPNDRQVGLRIPYEYGDTEHHYEPDFMVRLRGGVTLLIEIKGEGGERWAPDEVSAKSQAAKKWATAVNNHKAFGKWAFALCRDLAELPALLEEHAEGVDETLPFRMVDPKKEEAWRNCVPVTSLKAAAGAFSDEQVVDSLFPDDLTENWCSFDWPKSFQDGMFVAQVQGRSMEPNIPDGAWCLFGPPPAGGRDGKILLVAHNGINDPEYGAGYTVKRYRSAKRATEEGWEHTEITLEPLNPRFDPIRLRPEDESDVRTVAEFLGVLTSQALEA